MKAKCFYFQDIVADINRQWWVSNKRIELVKPFYMLQISPLLPEDSGTFKCRLETDPLFASDISSYSTHVVVLGELFLKQNSSKKDF